MLYIFIIDIWRNFRFREREWCKYMNVESICIFISGLYDVNCVCSDYVEMYIIILIFLFLYGLIKKLYCILFKK